MSLEIQRLPLPELIIIKSTFCETCLRVLSEINHFKVTVFTWLFMLTDNFKLNGYGLFGQRVLSRPFSFKMFISIPLQPKYN